VSFAHTNTVATGVTLVSQTSCVRLGRCSTTTRLCNCREPRFFWLLANTGTSRANSPLQYTASQEQRTEMSQPHSKKRKIEISQDLNFFTTTPTGSGSSACAGSFNNNTNSFNTTINNVLNHSTVTEDRSEILAWLSPLEPRVRHQNLEASRVDKVGDWLLETEQFQSWSGGNSQDKPQNTTIFCYGNPGAGKTYIW